ncbi:hypothetical protein B1A_15992 [mine drainage metagenome]|uniref:PIN domain-containing protein n=1 Tax=mine drainage metagenome TaxID=410659 RepID=T1AMS0_9ZZZZ
MRVVIDTNVIIAYLVSGSSTSTNYRVCQRVINGNDKAFSCDILYGELNRLLSLDPDLIQKIASASNKEGKFFSSLEKVNPQYLNARLDPLVTQLNFIRTESLSIDENALKDIGNDWYIISICKYVQIDYVITWNVKDILKYADKHGLDPEIIINPDKYLERV